MNIGCDSLREFVKKNYIWFFLVLFIILFFAIVKSVIDQNIINFDTNTYNAVARYISNDFTGFVIFVTKFGGRLYLIVISLIILIFIKKKKYGFSILFNILLSTLTTNLLKIIIKRPRPIGINLINEGGYSLPSGHSLISMAYYGYLIYLIHKNTKNKIIKYSLIFILSLLIISIGLSRIYLGVHYTSDVLAGFLAGLSYLIIYISFVHQLIEKRKHN